MASLISGNAAEHINFGRNLIRQAPPSMLESLPLLPSIIAIIEDYIPIGAPVIAAQMALQHPERNLLQCLPVSRRISLLQTYRLAEVSDSAEKLTMQAISDVNYYIQHEKGKLYLIDLMAGNFSTGLFFEHLHLVLHEEPPYGVLMHFLKRIKSDDSITKAQIVETIRIILEAEPIEKTTYGQALVQSMTPKCGFEIFDLLFSKEGLPNKILGESTAACLIKYASYLDDQDAIKLLDYIEPKSIEEIKEWLSKALECGNLPIANNLINTLEFQALSLQAQQKCFKEGMDWCVSHLEVEYRRGDLRLMDKRLKMIKTFLPKLNANDQEKVNKKLKNYEIYFYSYLLK